MRLLLIEDDADFAELYEEALDDCLVGWAPDAGLGLLMASSWEPDLVLLDVQTPDGNGIELLRQLRAHPQTRALPVVILGDGNDPVQRRQGRELGAVEWMVKEDITTGSLATWIRWWSAGPATDPEDRLSPAAGIARRGVAADFRRILSVERMGRVLERFTGLLRIHRPQL